MVTEDPQIKQTGEQAWRQKSYTPNNKRPAKKSNFLPGFIFLLLVVAVVGAGWYYRADIRDAINGSDQLAGVEKGLFGQEVSGEQADFIEAVNDTPTVEEKTGVDGATNPQMASNAVDGKLAKTAKKGNLDYLNNARVVDHEGYIAGYVENIGYDQTEKGTIQMILRPVQAPSENKPSVKMAVKVLNAVQTQSGSYEIALTHEQSDELAKATAKR